MQTLRVTRSVGLLITVSVALAGCASSGRARPEPSGPAPSESSRTLNVAALGVALISTALELTGIPYLEGGSTPDGFDCSGLTRYVFAQQGIHLPRQTHQQYEAGRRLNVEELRPGDLVFFTTVAPGASHVGLVIDRASFVHAPSEGGVVRVEQLTNAYWTERYLGARRVVE